MVSKKLTEYSEKRVKSYQKLLDGQIEFQAKVRSKSKPNLLHIVTAYKNGSVQCDCERWVLGHSICRHIKLFEKHYGSKIK